MSKGGNFLNFGSYGLKALTPERITSRQIESARRCISRHLKRSGRVWIRIFLTFLFQRNQQKLGKVKVKVR